MDLCRVLRSQTPGLSWGLATLFSNERVGVGAVGSELAAVAGADEGGHRLNLTQKTP